MGIQREVYFLEYTTNPIKARMTPVMAPKTCLVPKPAAPPIPMASAVNEQVANTAPIASNVVPIDFFFFMVISPCQGRRLLYEFAIKAL
jgi:hypothetical protein